MTNTPQSCRIDNLRERLPRDCGVFLRWAQCRETALHELEPGKIGANVVLRADWGANKHSVLWPILQRVISSNASAKSKVPAQMPS